MAKPILRTKLCDMFDIEYPIVLAGMGDLSEDTTSASGKLAAAVSNAGGLGIIGGGTMTEGRLREEIIRAKENTTKPFGVNILFPFGADIPGTVDEIMAKAPAEQVKFVESLWEKFNVPVTKSPTSHVKFLTWDQARSHWKILIEEGIKLVALGLGTPDWLVPEAHANGMRVVSLVGSVEAAHEVRARGVDLVIAQGTEAGGHTGNIGLLTLLPQVVAAVSPTPVLAAGGITNGSQLAACLTLGAVGVWVGTAFEATYEAEIPDEVKQQIIKAASHDARITKSYTGKTMRAIYNPVTEAWDKSGLTPLNLPNQIYLMINFWHGLRKYKPELLCAVAGQGVGMIKELRSVQQVVDDMVAGAVAILTKKMPSNITVKN